MEPEAQTPSPQQEPPESLVAALAWAQLHDPPLVGVLERVWDQHVAGSRGATAAISLLTIGWMAGRSWQASVARRSPPR